MKADRQTKGQRDTQTKGQTVKQAHTELDKRGGMRVEIAPTK